MGFRSMPISPQLGVASGQFQRMVELSLAEVRSYLANGLLSTTRIVAIAASQYANRTQHC